jgi:hypothetical protein
VDQWLGRPSAVPSQKLKFENQYIPKKEYSSGIREVGWGIEYTPMEAGGAMTNGGCRIPRHLKRLSPEFFFEKQMIKFCGSEYYFDDVDYETFPTKKNLTLVEANPQIIKISKN